MVLMIGGNIPGETQVLSIALFDHVETMDYQNAHLLAGGLMGFSLVMLVLVYGCCSAGNGGCSDERHPQGATAATQGEAGVRRLYPRL